MSRWQRPERIENRSAVSLHVYAAQANHRLQVVWSPQYSVLEGPAYEPQTFETVPAAKILGVVELSVKGVWNRASGVAP